MSTSVTDRQAYKRRWNAGNIDKVRGYRSRYYHANRSKVIARAKVWEADNPERAIIVKRAINAVQYALRVGKLTRPDMCQESDRTCIGRITAAHADYSKPLDIRWLCLSHHRRWDQSDPKTKTAEAIMADIRAAIRDRLKTGIERWERIVSYKQASKDGDVSDTRYTLHRLKCALGIMRSRAHQTHVTDAWLAEVARLPTSEIAILIEGQVPGGYPDPVEGRLYTKAERSRILTGVLTVPRAVYERAAELEALENPPDDEREI